MTLALNALINFSLVLHFICKPVICFAKQIKWLVSIWNATLGWNGMTYIVPIFHLVATLYSNFCSILEYIDITWNIGTKQVNYCLFLLGEGTLLALLTHFMPLVFLYPLKTSEYLWLPDVFRGWKQNSGTRWVKCLHHNIFRDILRTFSFCNRGNSLGTN